MDDLIKYLIWGFIIISFFSSFFKKNKKKNPQVPQQKRPENNNRDRAETYSQTPQKTDSGQNDIFKEIERLFKGEAPPPLQKEAEKIPPITTKSQTAIEKSQYQSSLKKEKSSEHFKDSEWHEPTYSEHTFSKGEHSFEDRWTSAIERSKKNTKVSSKIEKEAKKFEQILLKEKFEKNLQILNLKKKLKEPESIKEYIILSEILGHPKAFRR